MKNCLHKKGFTLVEILVAVMIVVLLVTMAVPLYEKTVEKSRMAEARTMLKKILDAKLRTLDNMETADYTSEKFGFKHLDISIPCAENDCSGASISTKDFTYTLLPTGTLSGSSATLANAVCAARRTGDNKGVNFLYLDNVNYLYLLCIAFLISCLALIAGLNWTYRKKRLPNGEKIFVFSKRMRLFSFCEMVLAALSLAAVIIDIAIRTM